jgi:hypothetical protein
MICASIWFGDHAVGTGFETPKHEQHFGSDQQEPAASRMIANDPVCGATLASPFKSRVRPETKNAALQYQLMVLRRAIRIAQLHSEPTCLHHNVSWARLISWKISGAG